MSIKQARAKGRSVLGKVADGVNPSEVKRKARKAETVRRGAPTVLERLAEWQDARAATWRPRYAAEVERLCTKIIAPAIGDKPLASTSRADWVGLIEAKRKTAPSTATWLYATASSFLNHCEASGWIDAPLLPRKGIGVIAPKAPARKRSLSDAELLAVWTASEAFNPKPRAFVRVLMLTALRELEAADLSVGEVDLMQARATLPPARTKNGVEHLVPLHPLLLRELQAIWPDRRAGEAYRLFGAVKGGGFRGFSSLKRRLDALLPTEMRAWRWHDLRRTAGTGMARLGVRPIDAECALNHIGGRSALERIYDRHDYTAEAIAALTVWQNHVAGLLALADGSMTAKAEAA
jgi:integrase